MGKIDIRVKDISTKSGTYCYIEDGTINGKDLIYDSDLDFAYYINKLGDKVLVDVPEKDSFNAYLGEFNENFIRDLNIAMDLHEEFKMYSKEKKSLIKHLIASLVSIEVWNILNHLDLNELPKIIELLVRFGVPIVLAVSIFKYIVYYIFTKDDQLRSAKEYSYVWEDIKHKYQLELNMFE